jgi:hypothetical protein
MKESTIRQRIMEECRRRGLFAFPIETGLIYGGIPDLCITGEKTIWLELKWVTTWPVRASTPVKRDLLRPAQVNWMRDYLRHGGRNAAVFARVGDEYFLFPASIAHRLNEWTQEEYRKEALCSFQVRGGNWSILFEELDLWT